ncbi:MAG: SprB repeat-containing protein, partial [Bacteroidota bacterium]
MTRNLYTSTKSLSIRLSLLLGLLLNWSTTGLALPNCNNVNNGGEIGPYEVVCGAFDPAPIQSIQDPSGGSGTLEIVWLTSTDPELPRQQWTVIDGAHGLSYDPGPISQTTYFLRCSRRAGCDNYIGESNIIGMVVNGLTPDCAANEEVIEMSGNAEEIINNSGVSNANKLLGPINGSIAKFYDEGDHLTVDLRYTLPAGQRYTITWKYRDYNTSYNGPAKLKVYESEDGINFNYVTTLTTEVKDFLVSNTIVASQNTQMIKLENGFGAPDFEVDAISYCNTNCIIEGPRDCSLIDYDITPGASDARLLWMNYPGGVELYSVNLAGASLQEFEDGTAQISGTAERLGQPDYQWIIDVKLINKRNWEEWSALGRDYKANDNVEGADHTTWSYYEMDNDNSTFTGAGLHAGKTLHLTHAPANYNYAFQIGYGANVMNGEYGLSGWFDFHGDINANGDFNGTIDNCTASDPCDNVTDGGEIGDYEVVCGPFDPSIIESIEDPTGGSGDLEIVWLTSTNPELPPWEWDVIEGATDLTYDPGFITVTTYFLRCTRREGCEEYLGESNIIAKVVNSFTPDCAPSEELIDVLGYAEKVKQNNGVDQANELLGAADGKPAKFYDANDNLLVDLRYNLPAGDRYTITWKFRYYNTSLGDTARLNVYESTDGVNFTLATTLKTSIRHFYVSQTITAGRDTRMIKLENDGSGPDFDVDAITFCNSTCISENPADCPLLDYETLEGANNTRLLWMRYSEGVELYSVNLSGASLKEYPDGTASITGTAERVGNPDYKWIINVRLVNKRNWEEWSALGRDYKPNDFFSGADHTTWTYYELDNNNSTFTGEGLHAGKTLNLTHAPANYNYAFQIGYGANVKNGEYGLSGWFDFTGDINAYGDFNGTLEECSFEDCITLNLSVDLNVTAAIDCQGEASGQLEAIPSEGLPPYSFLWSTGDTTQMVDSLPAGSYTVSITDDFGCVATTSIELLEPNEMTLSSVSEDTDCLDGETGSIDLTVEGGTAPYTFIWSNGATSEDINNLAANTYYVTVTDTKGCTAIHEDQITEPPLLEANCTAGPAICQGANNGIIELVVNGGTAPYTYSWSNGASSQNLDNLNEGTYSVIVTDANGCTSTCEASIQTSTDLVLSCSASNTDCSNITSGSISVNVEGGLAPFSFAWSNGATTQDLNEVPEGTYSLTVTDANNCSASCTATIENTPAIELNCTATDINCEGNNDGIITTTVTGGTPPFQYTWSNGATASNLDGLAEGTYSLTVSDANNCDAICSVTINAPTSLQAVCTATQSGCGADVLGDITLTVTGGTAPYTYQWNNEANGQNLLGVEAGSYSVIITDANGCVTQCGASIEPHSAIELTCSATNPTCNEQADAIITSNISGGTAPFTYAWSNGATSQNLDNLNAGTYTLTVTDAEGCSAVCSTTIEAPASLTANCQVSQSGCDANTAGDINLIVMGGTAPYTFAWNNGDTNQDLNAVPAGDYSVIITDANGCTATCSTTVESVSGFELACSPTPTNCADANSGSITVNLTGGLAPFSFNWSNGANSQDLTAVPAGSYSLTVTDANNCQAICTTVIEEAPGLNLSCSATEVDCNGGTTGEITTIVTGGVPPFIYTWSNSATTANLDNLPAGNYDLTVTDANACTAVCTASVNESSSLEVICTADQDPCGPNITGNINLNVTGGNSPYTFLWNTGASSQNLNNVSPGEYEVTITDANGCSTSCGASIIAYEELTASCLSTDAICSDLESGDVALTVTGGLLPYTYLWSNGATSKDLINIHAGIFTVTVTDANGCTASCSATVEASEAIFTNLTSSDASCFGS